MSRLNEALNWLASELSADAQDFRAHFKQGADDLRDGLFAQGLAKQQGGRYAVTPAGLRVLDAGQVDHG